MTTTKKYLTCAETATMVRRALKTHWPSVKFSVISKTYAGGASITVTWTNGPTSSDVKRITDLYEGADFNSMEDLKTYHDTILFDDKGKMEQVVSMGADYIHTNRQYTPEYDWLLCDKIDLTGGRPELKEQIQNLFKHQGAYPYIGAHSYAIINGGQICRIFSEKTIDGAERLPTCFALQGYKVRQFHDDAEGMEVFEVSLI